LQNLSVLENSSHSTITLTNTSGSGYSSLLINAGPVEAQTFCGGSAMEITTNSSHPMKFATNRHVNPVSLSIEADGNVVCHSSFEAQGGFDTDQI
jgi:hypothetical protein